VDCKDFSDCLFLSWFKPIHAARRLHFRNPTKRPVAKIGYCPFPTILLASLMDRRPPIRSVELQQVDSIAPVGGNSIAKAFKAIRKRQSFLWTVAIAFVTVGLQMAQGILLARLLHREGRGEYATAVFWSHFLMFVGLFGGLEVICRYANNTKVDPIQLRRSAIWLGIVTGLATMVFAMLGSVFLIPNDKQYMAGIACLCCVSILAQNIILIMTGVDRGSGDFRLYNLRRIFAAAALPVLIVLCMPFIHMTSGIVILLYVIGSFLTLLVYLRGIPQPFVGPTAIPTRRLLKESRPYAFSMLAADLFDRLDLMLVLWLAPIALQGDYAAMVPVVYPLIVIPSTLGMFLFNAGAKVGSAPNEQAFLKTLLALVAIQSLTVVGFWVVAQPFILLLYGDAFKSAIPLAMWLAPASAIKGIVQGLEGFLKGRGQPQASILCRIVAAVTMFTITLSLFNQFNVLAVAIAALISQIVCLVWIAWLVVYELRQSSAEADVVTTPAISEIVD
jgi:enterobacterial common antigen flippase